MNLKKYSQEAHDTKSSNVNILPVMSLFVMLIPFLLLTTVFVETAVFQLYLPKKKKISDRTIEPPSKKKDDRLFVTLLKDGIHIGVNEKISPLLSIKSFKGEIKNLKNKFEHREDIVLISEPQIKYSLIIDVMDILADIGFEQVSLAGN